MTTMKLNLEMNGINISYEGPVEHLNNEIAKLCDGLSKLEITPKTKASVPKSSEVSDSGIVGKNMSTTDVAVKLGCNSGTDLIMAAAAQLKFFQNKEDFKRSEILTEIKSAKSFFKQTYSNNLSRYLEGLVKGSRLSNPSSDTYSLMHSEEETLRGKLG